MFCVPWCSFLWLRVRVQLKCDWSVSHRAATLRSLTGIPRARHLLPFAEGWKKKSQPNGNESVDEVFIESSFFVRNSNLSQTLYTQALLTRLSSCSKKYSSHFTREKIVSSYRKNCWQTDDPTCLTASEIYLLKSELRAASRRGCQLTITS